MFVLEIGTEELPSHDVASAIQQLKDLILQLLEKQRLDHHEVQAYGTPRRLVVCFDSLCARQVENEVEVRGPPVSKAFDNQGNPTKAVEGFCRRYNTSLDSIYEKVDGNVGPWIFDLYLSYSFRTVHREAARVFRLCTLIMIRGGCYKPIVLYGIPFVPFPLPKTKIYLEYVGHISVAY